MTDRDLQPIVENDQPSPAAVAPVSVAKPSGPKTAKSTIFGALVLGGIAGAAILGPLSAAAASPPVAPTTTSTPAATNTTTPEATVGTDTDVNDGGPGGHIEAVTDASVIAKAIGITEADLTTALEGGKTVAEVAAANNVAIQAVIDSLVADSTSELAAQVTSGSITQAQADAEKPEILARATAQANGTFMGGDHVGPGGRGGFGGGGHVETITDTSVVAKAIGITEADLKAALAGGKTVAQVAAANNVAIQKVIEALVADGTSELEAKVSSGEITQVQADAEKAEILARATAQANGDFGGGRP